MKTKKGLAFALIILVGCAAGILIGLLARTLECSFLEDFSIIGPSAWVGYAVGCRCYGQKRYTTFKEWAAFIAAALLVTTVFWALTEYVF